MQLASVQTNGLWSFFRHPGQPKAGKSVPDAEQPVLRRVHQAVMGFTPILYYTVTPLTNF